jgi:asparagine synthase (glutamine-hydrolysing)
MCGIGGVWGAHRLDDPQRIGRRFADALAHRGPDGEGFLAIPSDPSQPARPCNRETIGSAGPSMGLLVHRRLSIIDLTTGDQPMESGRGRYWIVFNGEIYNYRDLRSELCADDHEGFTTSSDTEVILRAYRRWGIEGFRRLNGIFALALYDAGRRELVIARDPIGVKPLYWAQGSQALAFASEVRALAAGGFVPAAPDPEALVQYLYYRFVPAPRTAWSGVRKVRPGFAVRFNADRELLGEVDFAGPAPTPVSRPSTLLANLPDQLRAAVRRQMVADVPVGAFLSGGLDSSMVVAAMQDIGGAPLTFGIGFPGDPGVANELAAAASASRILGTTFEGREVHADSYFSGFPPVVSQVEEPLAQAGIHLLSQLAETASRRVKVVLTGQGADEPLAGYLRHQATRLALLVRAVLPDGLTRRWRSSHDGVERFLRVLQSDRDASLAAAPFGSLTSAEAGMYVHGCTGESGRELVRDGVAGWWKKAEGMDELSRILYVDVRTSLADDLLLMGDKTAMAHGLEARVPYLDLEYLASLESLPGPYRVPLWRRRKWIQHDLARKILPPELGRRLLGSRGPFSRKRGFEVPMDRWLRGAFGGRLETIVAGPDSVLPQYVNDGYVRRVVTRYLSGSAQPYRTTLALYVLELWLRLNVAGAQPDQLPVPPGRGPG